MNEHKNYVKKEHKFPEASTFSSFLLFVDGSASDQSKTFYEKHLRRAGIGIYHPDSGTRIAEPFPLPNPTNNRAEYWACIRALEWVLEKIKEKPLQIQSKTKVVLYCDSQLVIQSMTKWIDGWKKRNWKKADNQPVLNKELVQKLDQLISNQLPLTTFVKVKAHKKKPTYKNENDKSFWIWKGNKIADELSKQGRKIAEQNITKQHLR
jgi:ribonuclease HI